VRVVVVLGVEVLGGVGGQSGGVEREYWVGVGDV